MNRLPVVAQGVKEVSHLSELFTAGFWQIVTAVFTAGSAAIGFILALRNFPKLLNFLKTRETLVSERDYAFEMLKVERLHAEQARTSATDLERSLVAVRGDYDRLEARLNEMEASFEKYEKMEPVYEAALDWIPLSMESHNRKGEMPPVPKILSDYFKERNGDS